MHRLATQLGGRTVAEWSEIMGAGEFERWKEYYKREPFGAERDNWHMGGLASLYLNAHLKKGAKKSTADDFMYKTSEQAEKQKIQELMAGMTSLAVKKKKAK